jgi:hypothetical protein
VTYDITSSTDVESLSWELVGSDLPETCVNIQDRIANGTFTTTFDIDTTGASEGTWDVVVRLFGDDGADASNLCENTDERDERTFTDRITIEDNTDDNQAPGDGDSNSGGSAGGSGNLNANVAALIALIEKLLAGGVIGGSGSGFYTPALCAEFRGLSAGQFYGSRGPAVSALQSFLIAHGQAGTITYGATGYYGPQTNAAVSAYSAGCVGK